MNHLQEPHGEPSDDPLLEETFARLRAIEPPLETRIAIRQALALELALPGQGNGSRGPWWRRSVRIPVPLAASVAASFIVLIAAVLGLSIDRREQAHPQVVQPDRSMQTVADGATRKADMAKHGSDAPIVVKYFATEKYLCGLGRVSSYTHYFIEEP